MKVDFHVRLEEGPYSLQWLQHTAYSLQLLMDEEPSGSRAWADALVKRLAERISRGPFSRDWLDLYRMRAKLLAVGVVGVAEPLYRFTEFRDLYASRLQLGNDRLGVSQRRWLEQVSCESFPRYLASMEEEQKRWAVDGIQLRIGIELDYFPGAEDVLSAVIQAYPWDFCLGAVRFVCGWGMHLPEIRERFGRIERSGLYSRFFDLVEQAIESQLFDVIAPYDGFKSVSSPPDETSLLPYYQRVARALKRRDLAVEINAGSGFSPYRKPNGSCPLLEILAQHGVAVTLASGACYPEQLGQHWEEASGLLKRAGIDSIAVYDSRVRRKLLLGQ